MEVKTARGRLFFLLMLIVAFPFLQHGLSFFTTGPLNGAVVPVADSSFTWDGWWSGAYQKHKNLFLNDSTGFRADLVRLNNQLDYWLFNKVHANGVVVGKDECLYEQFYIDEYYGKDFAGYDSILNEVTKLRKVQDTMERLGKTFVFIMAPSKAYYFPEKLPESDGGKAGEHTTNYATFKKIAAERSLHLLDFNAWFTGMKDTSKELLFSNLGTHWTVYGSLKATDSIIKYIERQRGIRMPELRWNDVEHTDTPRRTDNDLAVGLNLISHFKKERFAYPRYFYTTDSSAKKLKSIYIGDSFLWMLIDNGLMRNTSSDFQIWYYFNEAWSDKALSGQEPMRHMDEFDWKSYLAGTDCLVLLYTPANIKGFSYVGSFTEQMYSYFYPGH